MAGLLTLPYLAILTISYFTLLYFTLLYTLRRTGHRSFVGLGDVSFFYYNESKEVSKRASGMEIAVLVAGNGVVWLVASGGVKSGWVDGEVR